jgi:hypothetical protein
MDHSRRWFVAGLVALHTLVGPWPEAHAKMSAWKDVKGTSFRGEPTEILGPYAVFRVGGGGGRRVL